MSTESPSNKAQPFYIAAAIAVIIFAVIGSASMLGWLPKQNETPPSPPATAAAPAPVPAPVATPAPLPQPPLQPPATAPAAQAKAASPTSVAKPKAAARRTETAKVCGNCGTIVAIHVIEQLGEATGLGAVAGGVAGALIGSQIGQGRGTTAAEIAGAAGGAYAGHQIEKRYRTTKRYEIDVRMDDGTRRVIGQTTEPVFSVGQKVRIINGQLEVY